MNGIEIFVRKSILWVFVFAFWAQYLPAQNHQTTADAFAILKANAKKLDTKLQTISFDLSCFSRLRNS
jgi:hypothetical protein